MNSFKKIAKLCFVILMIAVTAVMAVDHQFSKNSEYIPYTVLQATVIVGGQYTDSMALFRRNLSTKIQKLVWWYGKWSKLTGMMDVQKYKQAGIYSGVTSLRPTGKLIEVTKDFERYGGIYMDTPVVVPLTGQGRHGSAPQSGHEETRKILSKKIAINQLKHAVVIQDTKMSRAVLSRPGVQMALMERGAEDLRDWFSRKLAFYPYQALFAGYSDNLTDATWGVNKTQRSHPNFYVKGEGRVSFSNTFNAAYETAVAAALATLQDDPGDYFSAKSIRDMVYLANYHKIEPFKLGENELYIIFISPAQMRQLRQDSEWLQVHREAGVRGPGNQIFTGMSEGYPYEGAYVVVDNVIPAARISGDSGYDSTLGTVNYGVANYMASPRDSGPRKLAVLCGAGAVSCGYGSELAFTSEERDYKQFLGDEADMIIGMERGDIIDDDGYFGTAGNFYENCSSLIYGTYSNDLPVDI